MNNIREKAIFKTFTHCELRALTTCTLVFWAGVPALLNRKHLAHIPYPLPKEWREKVVAILGLTSPFLREAFYLYERTRGAENVLFARKKNQYFLLTLHKSERIFSVIPSVEKALSYKTMNDDIAKGRGILEYTLKIKCPNNTNVS